MRKPIDDEFKDLPISRQRKYQLRMERQKRCSICGEPAAHGGFCLKHLVERRERQRQKQGLKRRYRSLSYKLQQEHEDKMKAQAVAAKRSRSTPVPPKKAKKA